MIDLRPSESDVEDSEWYFVGTVPSNANSNWFPPENSPDQAWVPERVMEIIIGTASAYGAKFPARLGRWHERSTFNSKQVPWVIDELQFVGYVLNDELVQSYVTEILKAANKAMSPSGSYVLAFEGP